MNFCSVPYEADYGMYADGKLKNMSQFPAMGMNPGQGHAGQPLNPPSMNLQMPGMAPPQQMPSYPMPGMPLGMPMSTMSSQLPIGAVTPLSSMTMMPMNLGNPMGSIDAPGMNAVIPDLQPMSSMGQVNQMGQMGNQVAQMGNQMGQMGQPMQQYHNSGHMSQMHQGRLTGGASPMSSVQSSPSQAGNWNQGGMPASSPQMSNGGMWQYGHYMQQPQQSQQYGHQGAHHHHHNQQQHQQHQQSQQVQHQAAPHLQHQHHQQQQHQQQQQNPRMKSSYEMASNNMSFQRELRNGLNSPSMNDSKYSKSNQSFNCGKSVSKVPHWR